VSTLLLQFGGYFQMRMATDPDPTDELRGVSGYTFALAGEPDFDAQIHLQPWEPGVWQRKFGVADLDENPPYDLPVAHKSAAGGPRVGVVVQSASIDNKPAPEYIGARVQLLGAQILEYNGVLIRNDYFFIDPLKVRVTMPDGRLVAERLDWVNPSDPSMPLWEATSDMLVRRQPTTAKSNSTLVAATTGLSDASNETLIRNRLERQEKLKELREHYRGLTPPDETEIAALTTRIEQLEIVTQWWNLAVGTWNQRPIDRRAHQLTLLFDGWNIDVNGTVTEGGSVRGDTTQPWPLAFWMGGWDGDALTAWIEGTWTIPLA
jgi:hypothetical protein